VLVVLVFSGGHLAAEDLEAIARDRGGRVVRNAPNQPRNLAGNRKIPPTKVRRKTPGRRGLRPRRLAA
jgi:hypothetical protein